MFNLVGSVDNGLQGISDRQILGNPDEFRLHDAAGAFFIILEEFLDAFRFLRFDAFQDRLCLVFSEFRNEVCGVIRIHLIDDLGQFFRGDIFKDLFSRYITHFQDNVGGLFHFEKRKETKLFFFLQVINEFGDVGGVQ